MKISKLIALICLSVFLLPACQENFRQEANFNIEESLIKIPENMGGINFGGYILPEGTMSSVSADKGRIAVSLADNFIYIASDNGKILLADEGGYTCTSKCANGCNVVKLGNEIGCSACPKESSEKCIGQSAESNFHYFL